MEVVGGPSSSLVPVGGGPGLQHGRAVLGGLLGRHLQQLPVQDEAEHVVTSDVRGIVSFLLLYQGFTRDFFGFRCRCYGD